jgi:leucyl aminopeptidase
MVDAHAYRVSDIIRGYSGKSIEIVNTDAEGRIVLSDALSYTAKNLNPHWIVEFSTLTGAMLVTLGHMCAGAFVYHGDELFRSLIQSGLNSGERVHIFPHFDEISEDIKGTQSDLCNLGAARGMAGSMAGGAFLKEFVEEKAYAHIDIAGVANDANAPGYPKKGGSGYGIQLAVALAEELAKNEA